MVGTRDLEPLVNASVWVGDEVRKGFMEGPDRVIRVFLEDEE